MTKTISINQFRVKIYDTRAEMGFCAADEAAAAIRGVLAQKEECNMIFAAAPSQNEMLAALAAQPGIEWNRVNAFHMDEYIGLAPDAPQGFANFLRAAIFTKVPFRSVEGDVPVFPDAHAGDVHGETAQQLGIAGTLGCRIPGRRGPIQAVNGSKGHLGEDGRPQKIGKALGRVRCKADVLVHMKGVHTVPFLSLIHI